MLLSPVGYCGFKIWSPPIRYIQKIGVWVFWRWLFVFDDGGCFVNGGGGRYLLVSRFVVSARTRSGLREFYAISGGL
ncbi:hypothetical protein U1Q18_009761 [Sarracenia purpurea var. burkii]